MLQLRGYQEESLRILEEYLKSVQQHGAKIAFLNMTERPYRSVKQLPGLPYVCLRIPTGGGKTLMACHALGIAAREHLQADHAVCLWLVPSNTIKDQTLAALRDRQHPYRQVVDARFSGQVRVLDLTEALYVQRSALEGETVIIVSTLAALRVEDTEGRKIYEPAGALSHHFTGLTAQLEAQLEKLEDGTVPHSLANVLRMWRPIVIMDEAHNARTPLSFDTLARFNPSCIIEFTATPETEHSEAKGKSASNILYHVSAAELKAADMIKLPIKLKARSEWKELIGEALETQRSLEASAKEEERETGEYIRPVILFQAQPKSQERQTLTVDVVKQCLLEDFKIPEEQVAIATGQTREIDDVNLFDRKCQIRFIITVQALKEGWDCSFAYILCSVADIHSPRAVEQVLGRVLRMPRAKRKIREELNCAYAFAASPHFANAANSLRDALIENGFQRLEASNFIVPQEELSDFLFEPGTLFSPISELVSEAPDLAGLPIHLCESVSYNASTSRISVAGNITKEDSQAIKECFTKPENKVAVERIFRKIQGRASGSMPQIGRPEPFNIPALAVRIDKQLEMFEDQFLDMPWNLAECDASLSESEFSLESSAGLSYQLDVNDLGKIEVQFIEQLHDQIELLINEPGWTTSSLANWLDRKIRHQDITLTQSSLFIYKVIQWLLESRHLTLEQLAGRKFQLCRAIEAKIDAHRSAHRKSAYQKALFGQNAMEIEVSPELCLSIDERNYAPNSYYIPGYLFKHHHFPIIGDLKSEGEEFECARFIDNLPQVEFWIRNLERRPDSFWLQTSTDRFYPDFVGKLKDGRILVVESKGDIYWTNDDSKEKRAIGELWADRSKGNCIFVMPRGNDWGEIRARI